MGWLGWLVIGIVALNVVFFGVLALLSFIEDHGLKRWKR